ncbi:MAG: glycoside hydrolase family 95 protein [Pirellulaceae bacterium]
MDHLLRTHILVALVFLSRSAVAEEALVNMPWQDAIRQAAFVKEGLGRLYNPHYQYECIGLGGTTMRVGPNGFTKPGAPRIFPGGFLKHEPYLAYEYWWDEEGHRYLPFDLASGYGPRFEPGQITSFRHTLDIDTGLLTIDLGMRVDLVWEGLYEIGKNAFHSRRELFVTPDGVLVIRVTDSPEASLPFQLRVDINQDIRIYLNSGIYNTAHALWSRSFVPQDLGTVVLAQRPKTCVATLAIAVDGPAATVDAEKGLFGSTRSGQILTFYIAPGSSYESPDATRAAWEKAARARERGYDALRAETAQWWKQFYAKSSVQLPDRDLATWYARSLYYQGVFFGNTDIPPGCNAASVESFAGAICPEFDLAFSQFALLCTNHLDEARGITSWLARALPRAEKYATEGLTLHKTTVKYSGGAKYSTLMGYDGTVTVPPTEGEGVNAYSNYPGANSAAMALAYTDWAVDGEYDDVAKRILKGTTQVSLEDLQWREDFGGYLDRRSPSAVQQSAAIFGVRESLRRGVAEPGWEELASKIILPTADYQGSRVITAGAGAVPFEGFGDACWLQGLWWYDNISAADPLASSTYAMISKSLSGNYVFNNAWLGVYASKLNKGDDACQWARRILQPGVNLFDDTCLGEIVHGTEDFKKTPEIAAHAALICNVTQMLVDVDGADEITIFPAVPSPWRQPGVGFAGLAGRGGLVVSAQFTAAGVDVVLSNQSRTPIVRRLRVSLPPGTMAMSQAPAGTEVTAAWAMLPKVEILPGQEIRLTFNPTPTQDTTRALP